MEGTQFDKAIKELSPELRSKILSVLHKIDKIKCISCPKKRNELAAEFKTAVVEICHAKSTVALDSFCTLVRELAEDASQNQEGVITAFRKIKKDINEGKLLTAFDDLFGFEAKTRRLNGNELKNRQLLTDKAAEELSDEDRQKIAD